MALDSENDCSFEQDCSSEALEAIQGLTHTYGDDKQIFVVDDSDDGTVVLDGDTRAGRRAQRLGRRQQRTVVRQSRAERHATPMKPPQSL